MKLLLGANCVIAVFGVPACSLDISGAGGVDGGVDASAQSDATSPSGGEDANAGSDTYVGRVVPEVGTGTDSSKLARMPV